MVTFARPEPTYVRVTHWLIDDVAGISEGRIFVAHISEPRCFGELIPDDKRVSGVSYSVPCGELLCNVEWLGEPETEEQIFDMLETLADDYRHYVAVRGFDN